MNTGQLIVTGIGIVTLIYVAIVYFLTKHKPKHESKQ
jgi:hypothetical protein